jgi:L-asparagine oxygenase
MKSGFAFLPSHLATLSSYQAIQTLGTIQTLPGLREVQELTPRDSAESPPNIYSGNFGYEPFPFHTDLAHWSLPPRYLVLRCIEGTKEVRTSLIESKFIVQSFGKDVLCRTLAMPRRPIGMKRSLLRLLERCSQSEWRFRWDSIFIVPATKNSNTIFAAVGESLRSAAPLEFLLEKPGDTLIVDNWRMLHARSAVPVNQRNRKIHRAYLSSIICNLN